MIEDSCDNCGYKKCELENSGGKCINWIPEQETKKIDSSFTCPYCGKPVKWYHRKVRIERNINQFSPWNGETVSKYTVVSVYHKRCYVK